MKNSNMLKLSVLAAALVVALSNAAAEKNVLSPLTPDMTLDGAYAAAAAAGKNVFPPLVPLPPVPIPKNNPQTPEKIALGKQLFWESRLSGDGSMPCVSCHLPAIGWGEGSQISRGYPGTKHWRNSQTIINSAYYNKLFWAGSVTNLEAQGPSAAEGGVAGNGDRSTMEMRLRFIPEYVAAFKKVFGSPWPRMNDAYRAIASYERTIVSDATKVPFDRYAKGDKKALNASQLAGMKLFNGKAGCIQCHNGALASDQKFYDLGLPDFPGFKDEPLYQVTHRWETYAKGVSEEKYRNANKDYGLYFRTKNPKDIGKFRTPSLREVKYTAPYMHNGVFKTLQEVVDFYDRGGDKGSNKTPLLKPLNLAAKEKQDLIAFIEALSMTKPLIHDDPKLPGDYQPLPAPVK